MSGIFGSINIKAVIEKSVTASLQRLGVAGGAALVGLPNDVWGEAESVETRLAKSIGSTNPTLKSLYADGPTATVTGQEYLWILNEYAFLQQNGTPAECTTVFSGDSTTYGVGAAGETMSYNFERECDSAGFSCLKSYNRGHSGEHTPTWAEPGGYVEQDIAEFPAMGLYVARWGLNDGTGNTANTPAALASFETNLRLGLSKLRAFKSVRQLAIVLMTPNTISEDPNRNERWCELIQPIIRKAARDYQCCFIDTYQIWRDGRREGIGAWLDDAGAGQGIHPDKHFTRAIAQKVAEVALAPMRNIAMNAFYNVHGGKRKMTVADQPYLYPFGLSYHRTGAGGWPFDGFVKTERSADNIIKQTLVGFGSNLMEKSVVRYGLGVTTWGAWRGESAINCLNGWTYIAGLVSPYYFKAEDGLVTVQANLTGAAKTGDVVFQLPEGCRPVTAMKYLVHDTDGKTGIATVDNAGNVTVAQLNMASLANVYMSFTFHPYA